MAANCPSKARRYRPSPARAKRLAFKEPYQPGRYIPADHQPKPCLWCGTTFKPRNDDHVYCSKRCRMDVKNANRRINPVPARLRVRKTKPKPAPVMRVGSNAWAEEQLRRMR